MTTRSHFYLLLSVVPMFTASTGGRGAAGPATGLLMFSGVAAELCCTRLTARFGQRRVLAGGLLLLGAPALVPIAADQLATVLAVCAVRGFGFGLTVVTGGTLVVTLLPPDRRGEGLGLFAIVTCVPAVIALPAGVWLVGRVGYPAVFASAAVAALSGLLLRPGRVNPPPAPAGDDHPQPVIGLIVGLRRPDQHRLAIVFAATTAAAGIVVAFLPLAAASNHSATVALLTQATAATAARWAAGRHGDRHGHTRLLLPGLTAATAGIATLAWAPHPTALTLGALLFGTGFGISQSATLAAMLQRVPPTGYPMVNAAWNLAYDLGYGTGPVAFGLLVSHTGYPTAFAATAALMLTAIPPTPQHQPADRHRPRNRLTDPPATTASPDGAPGQHDPGLVHGRACRPPAGPGRTVRCTPATRHLDRTRHARDRTGHTHRAPVLSMATRPQGDSAWWVLARGRSGAGTTVMWRRPKGVPACWPISHGR